MTDQLITIGAAIGAMIVIVFGTLVLLAKCYVRVPPGRALVVTTTRGRHVCIERGTIVMPLVQRADMIDLTTKQLRLNFAGRDALLASDQARVELDLTFQLRVNATSDDILKVAERVGCEKSSDMNALTELFTPTFKSAVGTVVGCYTSAEVLSKRNDVEDKIMEVIGKDLDGYCLDKVAIERLEPSEHTGGYRG